MNQREYIEYVKKERRRKKDETPLEHAIRLVRLEALAYEGCGYGFGPLMDIADKLEEYL